jgi:apolipoprotein N-acyltransferase
MPFSTTFLLAFLEKQSQQPFYRLFLALSSGILLSVGWYTPFQILLFAGLVPILLLAQSFENTKKGGWRFFLYVWLAFSVWNIGAIWWLWNALGVGVIGVWLINALLQSLPVVLFRQTYRYSKALHGAAFFSYWVSFEYLHLNWELSFPWLNLGNAFGFLPSWVQFYEYTGAFGGTIWVLAVNYLLFKWLEKKQKMQAATRSYPLGAIVVLLLPLFFSQILFYTYQESTEKGFEVVVVQPNLDCYEEKFPYNPATGEPSKNYVAYAEQIDRFVSLAQKNSTPQTRYLLFPETALHEDVPENAVFQYPEPLRFFNALHTSHPNAYILTGIDTYKFYQKDEALSPTARKSRQGDFYYDAYNAALYITPDGNTAFYHKSKLVTGAEKNPLKRWLPQEWQFFVDIMGDLGISQERTVFCADTTKNCLAPIICYESIYGDFCTEYVKKGAAWLAVITNDGWWGNTPGHVQHLGFSALRAIELRRSVARSANTGISCFINQRGEILQATRYGETTAIRGIINPNEKITFFAANGDYLARVSVFLAFFFLISAIVKNWRN